MIERCDYPKHKTYKNYGGKGIKVCREWYQFEIFEKWALSHGYQENLEIDRIDSNGDYCPENCRWVTDEINSNNREDSQLVCINNESKSVSQWERDERCAVSSNTIVRRIKAGYSPEDAIKTPSKTTGKTITAFGETKTIADWLNDRRCNVSYYAFSKRLDKGMSPEDALTIKRVPYYNQVFLTIFGETKNITQWMNDSRCVVKQSCFFMRINKYGWDPEKALTTPAQPRNHKKCK